MSQPVLEGRATGRRLVVRADLPASAPDGEPTWPPRVGEQIYLGLPGSALVDVWGNRGDAEGGAGPLLSWTGGSWIERDSAAPELLRVCVRADGKLEIELSEEPSVASLGAISVDGVAVGWEVSADGYTLTSTTALAAGSRELVVGAALADLVGTALGVGWSGSVEVAEGTQQLVWAAAWPGAADESSVGNRLGFHGLSHDAATGLVYARHRDYDPELGRFVQTDPLGYVDSVSLYQYAVNDPVNFSDPTGQLVGFAVDAGFAGYDTYQCAKGRIDGREYALRMALTGTSVLANAASAGTGGLAVRAAAMAGRTGQVARGTIAGARLVDYGQMAVAGGQAAVSVYDAARTQDGTRLGLSALQLGLAAAGLARDVPGARHVDYANWGGEFVGDVASVSSHIPRAGRPQGWNEFQRSTRGQFASRREAGVAWRAYKESNQAANTLVIGRIKDTAAAELAGFQRLNVQSWTPAVNDAWVQGAIDARRAIKLVTAVSRSSLVSPPGSRFPYTVFYRELRQLKRGGYSIRGGWALPPGS